MRKEPGPRFLPLPVALILALSLAAEACGLPAEAADHQRRGDVALEAGRYGVALAAYTRGRELAPTDAGLQRAAMRARVHLVAAEPGRIAPEMMDDARYEAETLIEIDPTRKAVYLTALANLAMRGGDAEGARAKLDEAIKADPASALPHAALGAILLGRKDTVAQAKTELLAALQAKPDHIGALMGLAQVKAAEGDLPGAAEKLLAALKVRDDFGARMSLGSVYVQQQKPIDAAEQFQRAAQMDPKSADALGSLGQALLSAGRPEEAERALRSALELRADPPSAVALGFALVRQKKAEQALEVFGRILGREPGAAPAHYGAGLAAEALGRNEEAMTHYRALVARKPGSGDAQSLGEMQRDAEQHIAALLAAAGPTGATAPSSEPRGKDPFDTRQ